MNLSKNFTLEELTTSQTAMSRGLDNTPPSEAIDALRDLAGRLQLLRDKWGRPMVATNGYRSPAVNAAVGGAGNSSHMTGQAADIADYGRAFAQFCINNISLLEEAGLWMEDPQWTPTWVHLQSREVPGVRVFRPSMAPPLAPKLLSQGWGA